MKTRTLIAAAVAAIASLPMSANSQPSWPEKPLHIVVGYPAGTSPDILARLIADPLSEALGQPVVVENKAGAGGTIGVQQMLQGDPDYTIGMTTNGPLTTAKALIPGLTYDVATDLQPIILVGSSPLVLTLRSESEAASLEDFIAMSKAKPGEISYGSIGSGSGSHLAMAKLAHSADLDMLHVPFQSFAEVTNGIVGQLIDSAFMAPSGALSQLKAGNLKIVGITSAEPSPLAPDVAPIAGRAGFPDDFVIELWNGAIAPKDMPKEIVDRLNSEIDAILARSDIQEKMLAIGWRAEGGSVDALSARIADDTQSWGAVIENSGL